MMGIIAAISRGGAVVGLILLIVALLKQVVLAVGILVAVIKLAVVIVFATVMILIVFTIYRDHKKRKAEL